MLCGDSRLGGMEVCPGGFGGDGSVCTTGGCPTLRLLWTGTDIEVHHCYLETDTRTAAIHKPDSVYLHRFESHQVNKRLL